MVPSFTFPFPPYAIQEQFMQKLYHTIEEGILGIFESPTGTGKSLSICCSALQWLKDSNVRIVDELENEIKKLKLETSGKPADTENWLQDEYDNIKKLQELQKLILKLEKINKQKENYEAMKTRVAKMKINNKNKTETYSYSKDNKESKENVPGDTESNPDNDLLLDEVVEKNGDDDDDDEEEEAENSEKDDTTKIYISSRTHSQLSQFVGEIRKTMFREDTKLVTLASRQHFCVNPDVARLKNVNLINERCLDLQKAKAKNTSVSDEGKVLKKTKTKSCTSCPYYNQSNVNKLKERLLVDIMDMEDLVRNGKELKACPYYATRMAMEEAEVVLISHAGIVSSGARSGMSLKLQDNILILDEAHGLTAALEQAHSAPVSAHQLSSVKTYLQYYITKYMSRLSSRNLLSLNQIKFVVGKLLEMTNRTNVAKEETAILKIEKFVIKAEIDHLNLRPLIQFCRNSRLAPKLHGFSMKYNKDVLEEEMKLNTVPKKSSFENFLSNISKKKVEVKVESEVKTEDAKEDKTSTVGESSAGSALYAVLDFLSMLCDRSDNGRVLVQAGLGHCGLKYLLLNPVDHFADVVKACRSVIVAGGTMEPVSEFQSLLCGTKTEASDHRLTLLRCDHVVPPDNVLAICLSKGPSNISLNFSYENRQSKQLLDEVGRILRNICSVVPGGVVCFLPSYSYEQTVYEHMEANKVIEQIAKKKKIFREPKSATDVDQVLHKFSSCIRSKVGGITGALMLSVVGGKLSEGLNFSDDLGRCVVVIGMPYPNIKSPELQEKMNYLNRTSDAGAGSRYYESLCMKAVNQCIGRAVRHANDYASILLVDERYSRVQTATMLPSFVQKSLKTNCNFGLTVGSISKFFANHKTC